MSILDTDWQAKLTEEDILTDANGKQTVPLKSLRRLSREAGIKSNKAQIQSIVINGNVLVQCIYTVEFLDSIWVGTGESSKQNTDAPYSSYMTAMAESRAEARCLRKALGIELTATEEISGFRAVRPAAKIDGGQITLINSFLLEHNLTPVDLFNEVLSKGRPEIVVSIEDFTVAEASDAMRYLNGLRKKSKKATKSVSTKDARAAKKAELEKKLAESNT